LELESQAAAEKKETSFGKVLEHTRQVQDQELSMFLKRLDAQGEKLAQSLSLQELVNFKNMVKTFLKNTLGKSRSMQEETVWDYSGQPRAMARVAKIDRALEELGQQLLSAQNEPLKYWPK
jgi:uncharacterized protein YaaR (DUF327 family)